MDFRSHIQLSAHFFIYKLIDLSCKAKVTKLEGSIFGNQNILELYIHMSYTSSMV